MNPALRIALTLAAIAGFLAWLWLGAQSHGQVLCRVCVEYAGRQDCREGRGETREAAVQGAHSAACANLTSGVTNAFRCAQTPALTSDCR